MILSDIPFRRIDEENDNEGELVLGVVGWPCCFCSTSGRVSFVNNDELRRVAFTVVAVFFMTTVTSKTYTDTHTMQVFTLEALLRRPPTWCAFLSSFFLLLLVSPPSSLLHVGVVDVCNIQMRSQP